MEQSEEEPAEKQKQSIKNVFIFNGFSQKQWYFWNISLLPAHLW